MLETDWAKGKASHAATVRRSIRLARAFREEQSHPDRFYRTLAQDSAAQLQSYVDLTDAVLLDVGGGPGFFADAFEALGARYVALDADRGELELHGRAPGPRTVLGSGQDLPFRTGSVDVCYSSNVIEHVPHPWRLADEAVRVTKPGGTIFLSWTLWWGPWGGHETAPWHWVGGDFAARRYERRTGHPPKNRWGEGLFAVTAAQGLRWARGCTDATLVAALPRYLPSWSAALVRVPGVREIVLWNLALVLRRNIW